MEEKKYSFNSTDILYKVYYYRKTLGIVTGIAAIVSVIASMLITPQFKASVVMFPAPSDAISKSLISTYNASRNSGVYGEDEEVERILQSLNSDELKSMIVNKYDLYTHYEIDTTQAYSKTKLSDKYRGKFKFTRTPYMAVEVDVYDKDPELAAVIANDIPLLLDSVMNIMEKKRARAAYQIVKAEYDEKVRQMEIKGEQLKEIMQKGVYDFESQSEMYNKSYAEAIASGNAKAVKALEKKLAVLAEYGERYMSIRDFLLYEAENLAHLNSRLKEAKVDAERVLSHAYVINKAEVPDKKAKPKRSIIVITSVISAFVLCFVLLLIIESFQSFRSIEKKEQ